MDALEFAREVKRMSDSLGRLNYSQYGLLHLDNGFYYDVADLEKAVPLVEKWAKEHPIVRNVDHVAEGMEKLGYKVDKEFMANNRCPTPKATFFSSYRNNRDCSMGCETCQKWWLEEYKEKEND